MSIAELRPASAPGNIPSAEELVARARALAPKLRERAVRAERDRNIPQGSVDEFIEAGLIHTLKPKRWGGYEHDHEVAFDIAVELGKSTCGSSAACADSPITAVTPANARAKTKDDASVVAIRKPTRVSHERSCFFTVSPESRRRFDLCCTGADRGCPQVVYLQSPQ